FPKADRIYRIANFNAMEDRAWNWANGPPLMADEIINFIPEIEHVTRMRPIGDDYLEYKPDSLSQVGHFAQGGFFVDSSFFGIFDVMILHGNRVNPLSQPGTMVMTESLARKFFGEENPVGKSIMMRGTAFAITAVCQDFPKTQHFSPSYFIDWQTFIDFIIGAGLRDLYYSRGWSGVYTYVSLDEGITAADLEEKMMDFRVEFLSERMTREEVIKNGKYVLQPLTDIHLRSHLEQEIEANGNMVYVLVSMLAAIFILIIAGVNYVNLATVKTFNRMKEVGIRKVTGALRYQLVFQFIGESLFMAILSGILSILVIDLLLPLFNRITDKNIDSLEMLSISNTGMLLLLVFVLGLVSGIYPALFASRTSPIKAMKEMKDPGSVTNRVRVGLVILQFTVSIFMILGTIIIYRQMNYFMNKDMGFDKEHIIALTLNGRAYQLAGENPALLKEEISKLAFVRSATMISHLPGDRFSVEGLYPDIPREEDNDPSLRFLRVDEDFIPLMGIEILHGRNLKRISGDRSEFLLNESAVQALQLKNPLGLQATSFFGQSGEIVGVTRDFHYASLHQIIEPLVLEVNYDQAFRGLWYQFLLLRLSPGDLPGMIETIQGRMTEIAEGYAMDFTFIEDNIHKNYKSEKRFKELLQAFALFAIFISCLGLFGLSAFSVELRTKEMGIRKAMGASVLKIAIRMSRNFIIYVIFALIIALPLGYFFMNKWLENFAYHIGIQWWEFIVTAAMALVITGLSVGYQALRSGLANPVDSLRYE
ncbi:MAG: FtsX-like permease family protein, partial [Bacteroidales bacterium]|nr:FtsX-like permease family protein [Bacteroidales bacterium]